MIRRGRLATALALGIVLTLPSIAGAASSIEQIVAKTLTPQPGGVATFQVAVTPGDNTVWDAGTYTLTLTAVDPSGTPVTTAPPFTADEAATPQQTTMVFVDLPIPIGYSGPLVVRAHVQHGKTSDDSQPVGIVVGVSAAAAPQAVVAPASPRGITTTGSLALNAGFAALQSHSGVLNLSGKFGANDSLTTSGGLADTPGATKPVITFQTPELLTQIGTITPSFERNAFAGPSGTGIGFKKTWHNNTQILQGAYISGNHDTTNPFEMEALAYTFPVFGSAVTTTGGYENIYGPAQPGPFFLRNGAFAGIADDVTAPHSSFTYGIHYGLTAFHDDINNVDQLGDVFDLALGFTIRKVRFAFTYERASPYFANASAPGVTPDRENETVAVTIPLGVLQITLAANAYRDDLPGSTLLQTTHYATENIGITYPLRNGDVLSFQAVNGVQHQTGDPVAPFSGNDGTTFAYTTKRGPYAIQYTLADSETRDNIGDLLHVITNGITIARSPFAGVTISGGFNMNQNDASAAAQTTLSNSATASITYVLRSLTFSTQLSHALSHPYLGLSSPATTTYNYGVSLKPPKSPYSISATVTESIGMIDTSVGALSLNRQF